MPQSKVVRNVVTSVLPLITIPYDNYFCLLVPVFLAYNLGVSVPKTNHNILDSLVAKTVQAKIINLAQSVASASNQTAPTQGTLPDAYAHNPQSPLLSFMLISYDAKCNVLQDIRDTLIPKKGGLFSSFSMLNMPSINPWKAALLSADPSYPKATCSCAS